MVAFLTLLLLAVRSRFTRRARLEAENMVRRRRPPSQGWKTFLRNHVGGIASLDLFVVRTISFKLLYGLVILGHARRRLVTISVTASPTAQWIAGSPYPNEVAVTKLKYKALESSFKSAPTGDPASMSPCSPISAQSQ
jgi:hypothetical protein